jgi:hypothetical protein
MAETRVEMVPPLPSAGSELSLPGSERPARLVPRRDSMWDACRRRESVFSSLGLPRGAARIDAAAEEDTQMLAVSVFLAVVICGVSALATAALIAVTFDEQCFLDPNPGARYALSVGGGTCTGLLPAFVLWLLRARRRAAEPDSPGKPPGI